MGIEVVLTTKVLDGIAAVANPFLNLPYEKKIKLLGVGELTPTQEYWDSSSAYNEVLKMTYKLSGNRYVEDKAVKDESLNYETALKYIYGDNIESIEAAQKNVQSAIQKLAQMENAYFAIGYAQKTLTGAALVVDKDNKVSFNKGYYSNNGDGTVPFESANMLYSDTNGHTYAFKLDHSAIAGDGADKNEQTLSEWEKVKKWIKDILNSHEIQKNEEELADLNPYIVIRVACPVEVAIEFGDEILNSNNDDTYCDNTSFGIMDIMGSEGEIKMFCIDSVPDYNITLNGTDEGMMDYTIGFYDKDNNLYDERSFEGVPITADTVITTGTDENEDIILEIDSNGDGTIDGTWSASENENVTEPDEKEPDEKEPVHTHNYTAVFNWSDDNQSCIAVLTCADCEDSQTLSCTVTSETSDPTCVKAGETVYTAVVDFEGQTYTDTKTVAGAPATGHSYEYTDNGDGTHTAVCVNGDDSFTEEHSFEDGICVCGAEDESEKPSDTESPGETESSEETESPEEPESSEEPSKPAETVKPFWQSWLEKWFGWDDEPENPTETETPEEPESSIEETQEETEQPSESESESESSAEKPDSPGFNFWDWIFSWWN